MCIEWTDANETERAGHNELPYLPFPSCWPVYTPAPKVRSLVAGLCITINTACKFAEWLEFYAKALELNVWTSALVEKVGKDDKGQWNVTVRRGGSNGTVRVLHPTHVVIACGLAGKPYAPHFEGEVCQKVTRGQRLITHTRSENSGKLQGRDHPHR